MSEFSIGDFVHVIDSDGHINGLSGRLTGENTFFKSFELHITEGNSYNSVGDTVEVFPFEIAHITSKLVAQCYEDNNETAMSVLLWGGRI